ncbi:MAG TPA: hypothetical protein VJ878_04000, partial [Candidatus Izemoplasmatales bacterium]|nr:hypothetical protein [Candidatus Izemoplasmatales bacterium]
LNQQMLQYDIYYNQDKTGISGRVVYGQRSYLFSKDEQFYQLYINSSEYIEVINSKEDTPSQFTFRYMKNQSEMFSTNIILSENSGEYQADFIYQNNQGLLMRMAMSRQQADAIEVDYEVNDNAITFTGMYRVKVENEQITGKPFYRFTFNDESETAKQRPGNMPNDTPGHGPDKDDPPGHGPNNDDSPGKDDTPGNRPF